MRFFTFIIALFYVISAYSQIPRTPFTGNHLTKVPNAASSVITMPPTGHWRTSEMSCISTTLNMLLNFDYLLIYIAKIVDKSQKILIR